MNFKIKLVFTFLFLGSFLFVSAATVKDSIEMVDSLETKEKKLSFFEMLQRDSIQNLKLYMSFDTTVKKKSKRNYSEAFIVLVKDGKSVDSLAAEIRARGVVRNQICRFPPIKLKVSKKELKKRNLKKKLNDLKIVTHCKSGDRYEKYVKREFLVYELYNHVTPYSFRSEFVEIDYYDINSKKKVEDKPAILIEHKDELADRLGGDVVERKRAYEQHCITDCAMRMNLFQYMIGNTDWSYYNLHNLTLLKVPEHPILVPVPYDFDYSGLVNTEYSIPTETLPIENVKQRYFLGICREDNALEVQFEFFRELEDKFRNTVMEFPHLKKNDRTEMANYISEFFDKINRKNRRYNPFKIHCD